MSARDGGPAFPFAYVDQTGALWTNDGITVRDVFAANAPPEPQEWFTPAMPARPEVPSWTTDPSLSAQDRKDWQSELLDSDPMACSEALRAFEVRFKATLYEAAAWEREYAKQRRVQWPFAWADAMLAARERDEPKAEPQPEVKPPRPADFWPEAHRSTLYIATDADGQIFGWDGEPTIDEREMAWTGYRGFGVTEARVTEAFMAGTCEPCPDWRNSLEARP